MKTVRKWTPVYWMLGCPTCRVVWDLRDYRQRYVVGTA